MSKLKYDSGSSKSISSRNTLNYNVVLSKIARDNLISSGSSSTVEIEDASYTRTTTSTVDHEWDIITATFGIENEDVALSSQDTGVATINSSGNVTRVSNGTTNILAVTTNLIKSISVSVSRETPIVVDTFEDWVTGSLAQECSDAVDTRLVGTSNAGDFLIFSTQNHSSPSYVRDTSNWAYDIDLTPISPWNSTGGETRAGTLISPRHIIFSEHYQISAGATIRFVTQDNTIVTRTVSSTSSLSGGSGYETDITIGLLDSDVPGTISFAKVLPSDINDYFANLSIGIPALCLDQEEKAIVSDLYNLGTFADFKMPTDSKRLEFFESKIIGDSGNPAFLIINDELVIITTWTFGGAGSGPNIAANITGINAIMTSLGGGYQLTEVDLTGFPTY